MYGKNQTMYLEAEHQLPASRICTTKLLATDNLVVRYIDVYSIVTIDHICTGTDHK
jgi:hypothetical protein